jgi:SAM-dependent methyltransferase
MSRLADLVSFIEYDYFRKTVIEPEKRLPMLKENLRGVVTTYKPGTIVKAGLGGGRLVLDLAESSEAYIVVVEPSLTIISDFLRLHGKEPACEKIRFINGEFNAFPIDYYAADLLICIDNFNFLESGKVVDEFRRALQFDGVLLFAGVVLHDEDINGVYDDFMKKAFPLHNDFYLRDDLKTFMDLNELSHIKGSMEYFSTDLAALADYFAEKFSNAEQRPLSLIEQQKKEFTELYKLNETTISEPYYIGVFMRRRPA